MEPTVPFLSSPSFLISKLQEQNIDRMWIIKKWNNTAELVLCNIFTVLVRMEYIDMYKLTATIFAL